MSLVEYNLFGEKRDKVQRAIDIVRSFEPPEGYYLADSGGKDSTATKAILRMAGVKYESHYNVTTVDPPELVRFVIRQNEAVIYDMPDGTHKYFAVQDTGKLLLPVSPETVVGKRTIHFSIPKHTMRELIVKKQFPPTRLARYCCEKLKEANGEGRVVVTGVRWAESLRRKNNQGLVTIFNGKAAKVAEEQGARYTDNRARGIIMNYDDDAARRTVELCYRTNKTIVNPIIAEGWNPGGIPSFGQGPKPRTVESKIQAPRRRMRTCGNSSRLTTSPIVNSTTRASSVLAASAAPWAALYPRSGSWNAGRSTGSCMSAPSRR